MKHTNPVAMTAVVLATAVSTYSSSIPALPVTTVGGDPTVAVPATDPLPEPAVSTAAAKALPYVAGTLSRRAMTLPPVQISAAGSDSPVHILIDSTGLKVHRGRAPRDKRNGRQWRKLHLVVDADTGDILASALTTRRASDCAQVPSLLAEITRELASVMADGAYDTRRVYSTIEARPARSPTKILIPPRSNARSAPKFNAANPQDDTIRSICELGIRHWRNSSGYTRRSLVETAISRFKLIIGRRLRSRTMASQRTEARIACRILNRMTARGMPNSYCAG